MFRISSDINYTAATVSLETDRLETSLTPLEKLQPGKLILQCWRLTVVGILAVSLNVQLKTKMYLLSLCKRHQETGCPGHAAKASAGFPIPMCCVVNWLHV